MNTYFISDGSLVKIGRSCDPQERLAGFQTSSANVLTLLLVLPGDQEYELHQRFQEDRVRGEWFQFSYQIRKFIAAQTGRPLRMNFYTWLLGQRERQDDVGRFAVVACSDPKFPRVFNQLILYRRYYNEQHTRNPVKGQNYIKLAMERAHAEWRVECSNNNSKYLQGIQDKSQKATA